MGGRNRGYYGPSDSDTGRGALIVIAALLAAVAVIGYCVGAELWAVVSC